MKITVRCGNKTQILCADAPVRASTLLARCSFPFLLACGGNGTCGKCRLRAKGNISTPDGTECRLLGYEALQSGVRLACRLILCGDAELILPPKEEKSRWIAMPPGEGEYDLAVDLGTTTLEAAALLPGTERIFWEGNTENRQRRYGADVVTRLAYAQKNGAQALRDALLESIAALTEPLSPYRVRKTVFTGNTAMLHFAAGLPMDGFYTAPFSPASLLGTLQNGIFYPRCIDAFLGADLCCGIAACGLTKQKNALLLDLGTNCEMAFWDGARLHCASAPAGPAFEGGNIRCGMRAENGAIDRVFLRDGAVQFSVLGGVPPRGLCAGGLIDLVALLRRSGIVSEDGYLKEPYRLADNIVLLPEDVRAFQTAKAAVAAGMRVLLHGKEAVNRLCLSGNFGTNLPLESAAALGLLPQDLLPKTVLCGNTALRGAAALLERTEICKSVEALAKAACSVSLAGNAAFEKAFLQNMALRPFTLHP